MKEIECKLLKKTCFSHLCLKVWVDTSRHIRIMVMPSLFLVNSRSVRLPTTLYIWKKTLEVIAYIWTRSLNEQRMQTLFCRFGESRQKKAKLCVRLFLIALSSIRTAAVELFVDITPPIKYIATENQLTKWVFITWRYWDLMVRPKSCNAMISLENHFFNGERSHNFSD